MDFVTLFRIHVFVGAVSTASTLTDNDMYCRSLVFNFAVVSLILSIKVLKSYIIKEMLCSYLISYAKQYTKL